MIEKVNPKHPDKIADRIRGALVDLAYTKSNNPKIAVEVLIGHGKCYIISETSVHIHKGRVKEIAERIAQCDLEVYYIENKQDPILSKNQDGHIRCGDNGIFKGVPLTKEQRNLSEWAREIYKKYDADGKYILDDKNKRFIICQSNAPTYEIDKIVREGMTTKHDIIINPLGFWTGGIDVDTGATNRKLGSDMADAVTGGGLHGKDLSKADVSVNIYAFLKAQKTGKTVKLECAIGDTTIDGRPYEEIVEIARRFITRRGGFEKLAEWGLF